MPPVPPRRRRARPVADAPVDALLSRSEEIARGWLLALLEQAPLQAAPAILTTDLAREAPRLCDALVRALADDRDLRRLDAGGALRELAGRTGRLAGAGAAGAGAAGAAARAVDALCDVVWAAMLEELRRPDGDLVADLSQRLAQVGEVVRDAVLEAEADVLTGAAPPAPAVETERRAARVAPLAAVPDPVPPPVPEPLPPEPVPPEPVSPPVPEPLPPPVPEPVPPEPVPPPVPEPGPPPPPPPPPALTGRPVPGGHSGLPAWPGLSDRSPGLAQHETLWVQALEDEIQRADPGALALLAAELEDAERIAAAEPEPGPALGRFASAVRSAVRRNDILVSETDARAWIIARETGRAGATTLARRISGALRGSDPWHGAPLTASIGVAVFGQDGRTAGELIEAAEEARFAAAAGGVDVLGADESFN